MDRFYTSTFNLSQIIPFEINSRPELALGLFLVVCVTKNMFVRFEPDREDESAFDRIPFLHTLTMDGPVPSPNRKCLSGGKLMDLLFKL